MQQLVLNMKEFPYEVEEELKSLRTNIQLCGDDKRVILFTSCQAHEGKSTATCRLAFSLADLGKSVLLIDTDLRQSIVKERIQDGRITTGLTHYLAGQCSIEQAMYQTQNEKVHLIPAGAFPPNPSELLSSPRMDALLQEARNKYDYVLVDTAPLGLVTDAAIVAQKCDGAILLMESGAIKYRAAQDVLHKLQSTRCPVLGVVLNKVPHRKSGYYGYGDYGDYYKKNR